ncbi:MAG: tRNA-(ms[2]io[6]A)-hydroxylase [Gammaproteobacteria bacterium]|jgi:tRNA 2-(methylsulfanyl)-N6-isopentenyladenosine37 hydroxylase|nr:tRNA-(ms[2]io[6]A)-hydroxylase [Gammaproteobacteria bacterium]MBT4492816.1 tRNA-(ms[2]io[6]A)-hydroxylase [Gammaproteobacteria bacterium]
MTEVILKNSSSDAWVDCVLEDFDQFLIDHAANERKASAMAMSLVAHYPDKQTLVTRLIDLALEEMNHFRQVIRLMQERDLTMTPDEKDPYVNQMRSHVKKGSDEYFLDRLLSAALIEARGEERFRRLADRLEDKKLKSFYTILANSEQGHHELFVDLSERYFDKELVSKRLAEWVDIEDVIFQQLPLKSRVH